MSQRIVQAPMAGGPSTPELAIAVCEAGGLGFLAAGFKRADAVRGEIRAVRAATSRRSASTCSSRASAAARRRGDADAFNLWAGQAH